MTKDTTAKAWTKPELAQLGTLADVAGAQGAPPVQNVAKS